MQIHNLGFPRIGAKRELKFSLEKYWRGDLSKTDFLTECKDRRQVNWQIQQQAGIELLPVGDFAHYDHVLNTTLLLGLAPERFSTHTSNSKHTHSKNEQRNTLDLEFRIGRGQAPSGCQCAASDMTKWFNTNYHYIVPELSAALLSHDTPVNTDNLLAHFNEAQTITDNRKVVLLGPITYLYLSVSGNEDKLALLPALLTRYQTVLTQLSDAGVQWLQLDEPVLGLELDHQWQQAFTQAYQQLKKGQLKVLLTSYFASIDHHIALIKDLAFDGLHIDTIAEQSDVVSIIERLPNDWIISLGVINGRNVWKTDLVSVYQKLQPLYKTLGARLWLAPSCSLLHSPVDLDQESKLDSEFKSWLAFAKQKCQELSLLKSALVNDNSDEISQYSNPAVARRVSKRINNIKVQQRVSTLTAVDFSRKESFEVRKVAQQAELNLPLLPTTTIGSFPQTGDIRETRAKWRRSEINDEQYTKLIQDEIRDTIKRQEEIGLDVLVHGEAERNDMVEYFGELLEGVAFTQFAWVQSYGSRCVKPPIIFGDISRKKPMTVEWASFAQSLTDKPVKGMLTGPITILCWSFVRDDLSREQVAKQIALAISDEVVDLIASGIQIIQIDEPAIREGMPVKQSQWQTYLDWATASFCLSAAKAPAATQIHSHMCYSEFNDILPAIVALDADVLTVETSRSNMSLLDAFDKQAYPNDLGPGVYDIHTPNVPEVDWMVNLIGKAQKHIPVERLWVNPDCGLKTRGWTETKLALENMVNAAKQLRKEYQA
ncbi:5-methyltetrahydropteroyltriglutamate--homocysteine S-methyltransferase [Colwellia piezophila]|uniref:5-methyltetrahydropteroyltriglutamate-- homocysteine S-methyltransferase n=1 Tax=Colwellia piezophila TaxID=211668 RepID=UPI00037D320C|nr:5-methyltetrahydropteroyltriglutamate--homocysteine S-methyltransferase [Colwellia piezophila]